MKRMMKLVMVLMCMFSFVPLSANQANIKVSEYNDELKRQLSLNYEFLDSKEVRNIEENVALEYHLDDLVLIVDISVDSNSITMYVNNYESYEKYLISYNNTTSKLLDNCVKAINTDNVFGASVIYKIGG